MQVQRPQHTAFIHTLEFIEKLLQTRQGFAPTLVCATKAEGDGARPVAQLRWKDSHPILDIRLTLLNQSTLHAGTGCQVKHSVVLPGSPGRLRVHSQQGKC